MKFGKNQKRLLIFLPVMLVTLLAFKRPAERYFEITKNLDIFATLYREVNAFYVDDVNPNILMENGIDGMLANLDPYTNYIPEDDIENYRTMTTGQYGGIGALIGNRGGKNMVVMPYSGFPADESGIKIGDELISVDGINITEKSIQEITKLLKGQANTDVSLEIKRPFASGTENIKLTRKKITVKNVPYYGMVTEDIGFVKLSDFTENAGKEVRKAVEKMIDMGAKKMILDLRNNPGGLLNEAVNVSSIFVDKGSEIVSTKGKVKEWNKTYKSLDNPVSTDMPLVVLTSSRSASASEIVAGVVQDYDRGVLVGKKSFGKGLVQATRPLNYNSQLKITTAKYYIPSGRCIQAIDYSNRNADGSVGKIADSLQVAFKTQAGRVVYDGGGVDVDIKVDKEGFAPITNALLRNDVIFDYATAYFYENAEIPAAKDFELTAAEYNEFVAEATSKEFDYMSKSLQSLTSLEKYAKAEKYYDDIADQLESLKTELKGDKVQDLQRFKEEIMYALEEDIVSRYYLQEGIIENSFGYDKDLKAAISVLNDATKYQSLLKGGQ